MDNWIPQLIVFDLDILLPWTVTWVPLPYMKDSRNNVLDANGKRIRPFPESLHILHTLTTEGYEVAVISNSTEWAKANVLLHLFGYDQYIKYKEFFPGAKTSHLFRIKNSSGIGRENMLFFGDEHEDTVNIATAGVPSFLITPFLTLQHIQDGIHLFTNKKKGYDYKKEIEFRLSKYFGT